WGGGAGAVAFWLGGRVGAQRGLHPGVTRGCPWCGRTLAGPAVPVGERAGLARPALVSGIRRALLSCARRHGGGASGRLARSRARPLPGGARKLGAVFARGRSLERSLLAQRRAAPPALFGRAEAPLRPRTVEPDQSRARAAPPLHLLRLRTPGGGEGCALSRRRLRGRPRRGPADRPAR